MSNPNQPEALENPLAPERTQPFIEDLTRGGQELFNYMSAEMNRISFLRAMQTGYLMACQDYGLPYPEFGDPAKTSPAFKDAGKQNGSDVF